MATRKRYRSSGSLISQLLEQDTTLGVSTSIVETFDQFQHRSSKMVLKKLDVSLACMAATTSTNLQRARFAIIAKPISEGVPVTVDLDNEKYNKWQRQCYALRVDSNNQVQADFLHVEEILKIVVELGWNLFMFIVNEGLNTIAVAFAARLFVKYI